TNVVGLWVRHKEVPLEMALEALEDANSLVNSVWSTDALWARALELAVEYQHPAYDTLFIALAELRETRVVSYDKKLKKLFPEQVMTPGEFLSGI
ncbi:type II toxin-antitoxin system VapC family toxin, partial [Myxococcota bacterium]|nr:type II toxin-antitoxin system VapC family toxin [Myxococcota bacterium]